MAKDIILYGRHAVLEALNNPNRKISKLLCTKDAAIEIKGKTNTKPIIVDKREIDRFLPNDAVHQGFALFTKPLEPFDIEDILRLSDAKEKCWDF